MKEVLLEASLRKTTGKGSARQSRMAGNIPAVVYGPEIDSLPIEISEKVMRQAVKDSSFNSIFDLKVDGKSNKVLIRDIHRDPISLKVTHLDFHAISMTKPIRLSVPIVLTGESIGVKTDGGLLQSAMREIEISCLPKDIIESIEVDVSELNLGDSIHIRDISIENVTILAEERRTVVICVAPSVIVEDEVSEEDEDEAEGVEGAEGAEGTDAPAADSDDEKKDKK